MLHKVQKQSTSQFYVTTVWGIWKVTWLSLTKKRKDYHGSEDNINGDGRTLWLLNPWPNGLY